MHWRFDFRPGEAPILLLESEIIFLTSGWVNMMAEPNLRVARFFAAPVALIVACGVSVGLPLQPVHAQPSPARAGSYHCVFFINGMLQTVPGFTLRAGGRYTHQNGGGGAYKVNAGVIEFSGGPLTGQAGKVSTNRIHLFNESRSRTVIDCDTKG